MKNGKTLTLVKMGCDFFDGDRISQLSDCGNYRIETRKDLVKGGITIAKLTDEQARAYIAGETFDPSEYERQHILMLVKSAETALAETSPEFHRNLRKTVARYIENHRNTTHTAELDELVRVYNEIKET